MSPPDNACNLRMNFRRYRRPFRVPLRTAHGEWAEREGLLVRLEDGAGRVGIGEAAPVPGFGPETTAQDAAWLEAREDAFNPAHAHSVPEHLPALRWAVDCALAGLAGETPSAGRVPVAGLLPAGERALAALPGELAAGRRVLKWKIAVAPAGDEFALADELAKALPEGVKLRLDANGGLDESSFPRWLAWCALRHAQIDYLEQPLPPGQEARMRELAREIGVPVALDESVAGVASLIERAESFPEAVLVVKPSLLGAHDAFRAWRVANPTRRVVYSSVFETVVGLRAAWAFAARECNPEHAGLATPAALADDGLCPVHVGAGLGPESWPENAEEGVWTRL